MSRTYRATAYKQYRPKSLREHRAESREYPRHNNIDDFDNFFEDITEFEEVKH